MALRQAFRHSDFGSHSSFVIRILASGLPLPQGLLFLTAMPTVLTNHQSMLLAGKVGIVCGVANKRSIAWAIAQAWHKAGATLAFTYQGERLKENVQDLAGAFGGDTMILPCDVASDDEIVNVFKSVGEKFGKLHLLLHSVAFAPKEALEGEFINTSREAFRIALDVTAF